jgi:hypothetical protein
MEMKNVCKVLFVYLLVTLCAGPALAQLSYEIDVGQDGTFETGGSINLNVSESVSIDIYVSGYNCTATGCEGCGTNDQLFGTQKYVLLDESKVTVVNSFPYDTEKGGPWDSSFCDFSRKEEDVYYLSTGNFNYVTVADERQKLGTITLTGASAGTSALLVANDLTPRGYPAYNDGSIVNCNLDSEYPADALLTVNPGCETDEQCNDNNPCTTDSCNKQSNSCIHTAVEEGTACDDGIFCNGIDTCSAAGICIHQGTLCPDDGIFCNGDEVCGEDSDACIHTGNPCPSETHICIEETDECEPLVPPVTLQLTPEAWYQSRWVSLIKFLKIEGSNSHFDRSVTEVSFSPDNAVIMLPRVIDETTINCFGLLMPRWWAKVDALDVTVTTGSEEATATMEINLLPFLLEQGHNASRDE